MAYVPNSGSVVAFQGTVPFSVLGTTIGSVISVQQGSVATVIIGGSIAASFTPPANQSISGTAGASVIGAVPINVQSSVATVIIGGSIAASFTPPANQSVSGNVGIVGNPSISGTVLVNNGSVVAFQGGAPWASTNVGSVITTSQGSVATVIIGGSIAASFTPPANQSVSGTVQAGLLSTNASVITLIQGSVAVSVTPAANQSVSGTVHVDNFSSVVAYQLAGSILATSATVNPAANQSVSGTVGASVIGTVPVTQTTVPWLIGSVYGNISGSVAATVTNTVTVVSSLAGGIFPVSGSVSAVVTNFPTTQNVSGSVVSFQGGAPWANTNVGSVITVGQGSIAVNIISGSIAASFTPPANQSVSGTVLVQGLNAPTASITGNPVYISGSDQNGSVAAFKMGAGREALITGSIQGTVSVLGTVPVTQSGAWTASIIASNPLQVVSSLAGGLFPIAGSVAATVTNTNLNVGGSVVAFQGAGWSGSVAATITNTNVNVSGSVTATQVGTWKTSIASNYAAGAASVISAIGNLAFGVRNDTLASVLATSDGQYIPWTVGPAGENITANAPLNKWVQGTTSVLNQFGTSMATIAAQGTSIFTYITSGQVANMSGSSVLVTFSGATSSVIGYTIAPPGGGSNMVIPNAWKSNANGAVTASVSGAASVYISLQGFISKT